MAIDPSFACAPRRPKVALYAALFTCAVAGSFSVAACGGASYSSATPPTSLGQAEQDVDAAEAKLGMLLGTNHTTSPTEPGEQPGVLRPTAPPVPPSQPGSNGDTTPLDEEDRCKTACDALGSMLRAVDRLCDLTGQGEDRCQNARTRANRASERVAQACPSCIPT